MTILFGFATPPPTEMLAGVPRPVRSATTIDALLTELGAQPDPAVIVGSDVPIVDAMRLVELLIDACPTVRVIVQRERLDVAQVREAMRAGAHDVVELCDVAGLAAACLRPLSLAKRGTLSAVPAPSAAEHGKIITVFSPKGGAGKTTLSTNLSVTLNDGGSTRVCLVDLDLAFGDVGISLQLQPLVTIVNALGMSEPDDGDLASVVTNFRENFDCLLAPISPSDIERIPPALVSALLQALTRRYDYVVVDTPSQLSEHVLAALDVSDALVLVTTPELPSLKNLRLTLDVLETLEFRPAIRAVVLNRADDTVGLNAGAVERILKCPLDIRVPSSQDVPRSINRGVPIVAAQPEHPVSAAIRRLAAEQFSPAVVPTAKHRGITLPRGHWRRRSA